MKKKIYLVGLFSILFVSISSLAYMQIKISKLKQENAILKAENNALKKSIDSLYKNFKSFSNKQNNDLLPQEPITPKKEIYPKNNDLFDDFPSFFDDEIYKQFQEMEKHIQEMNEMFSNPDNFGINLKINGSDLGGQVSIMKHFSVNGKDFSYSINSSRGKINGDIKGDDNKILNDLKDKLEKIGLKTTLKGSTLSFSGEKIDVNKVTGIIDDYINENYNKLKSEPKKKKLVPGKDYF